MRHAAVNESIIRIEGATVSYREDVALREVSLEIESGEFVGIIGPNGSGKTTLLTVVNGLGNLCQGEVWVLGQHLNGNGNSLRKRIGYVPQQQNIDPRMPINVREAVMMGRYGKMGLLNRPGAADWTIVDEAIRMVGMKHLARRPIGHLSGGEQQRVAIARALAQEPEILLLDEPTASLDWRAQRELLEMVRRIHDAQGLTTLFVTHDLNSLPQTCDRLVLMKQGRIWHHGHPRDVLNGNTLSQLYGAPIFITEPAGIPAVFS
ncbi:MAG: ABC transporter ATP-binding protein [Dehalococcoidia bacterium]|nr:ABC transporter ATP-binding protein [Dehalococcoidia bacterium]